MITTKLTRLGAIAALSLAAALTPAAAADNATVGDLIIGIAGAWNVSATDARGAADGLANGGVRLPADLRFDKQLTEADVTEIGRTVGLRLTTSRPQAAFDARQLDRFLEMFRDDLLYASRSAGENPGQGTGPGNGNGGPPFDPFSKGKGLGASKGKGKQSPAVP